MQKDVSLSDDLALRMRELAKALNLRIRSVWALTKRGVIPTFGFALRFVSRGFRPAMAPQAKANGESAPASGESVLAQD